MMQTPLSNNLIASYHSTSELATMDRGTPLLVLNARPPVRLLERLAPGPVPGEVRCRDGLPVECGPAGESWARLGELWAADGGGNALWRAGLPARAVVGDLDSLLPEARDWHKARGARIVEQADQDCNDLEKALACLLAAGVERCWVAAFEGGRLDMLLGLSGWLHPDRQPRLRLLGEEQVVHPLTPGRHEFDLAVDEPFSLVPLAAACQVEIRGARWEGPACRIEPGCRGVSNRARGGRLLLAVAGGAPLLVRRAPWAESPA
jgi:thiamine pyrophosphokinase